MCLTGDRCITNDVRWWPAGSVLVIDSSPLGGGGGAALRWTGHSHSPRTVSLDTGDRALPRAGDSATECLDPQDSVTEPQGRT